MKRKSTSAAENSDTENLFTFLFWLLSDTFKSIEAVIINIPYLPKFQSTTVPLCYQIIFDMDASLNKRISSSNFSLHHRNIPSDTSVATLKNQKNLKGPIKKPRKTQGQISMQLAEISWKVQLFPEKTQLFPKKVPFIR